MNQNIYDLLGLASAICFILALKGLSTPKTARRGNLIGAAGATIATVVVFFAPKAAGQSHHNTILILAAIAFGVLVGVPAA
ncbi:MAG: NAD(P)(+) transhydrogenase (Re/Si-specific) subunit beta, partial [Actinomycetes bacterium]